MIAIQHKGRPIDLEDPLFVRLINCATTDDHLAFVERFGDLGGRDVARFAKRLCEAVDFLLIGQQIDVYPNAIIDITNNELLGARLQPRLIMRGDRKRLILETTGLAEFLVIEMAFAVESGVKAKRCEHCNKLFLYGSLTGHRSRAKYCADRCRVAATRARNNS